MKKYIIAIFFALIAAPVFAQDDRKQIQNTAVQSNPVPYRLFATQNMWTFIKLDTRNGQMWQVHFGMGNDSRQIASLNSEALVSKESEMNDRFILYPTQNIYNFVLLDQFDGKTWQVQWSFDANKRGLIQIE